MKTSALALAIGLAFSSSAFATVNSWDTTANPWGSATVTNYAEWNIFGWDSINGSSFTDATPDIAGSGSLTATGTPSVISSFNIYSPTNTATSYTASLAGSTGDVFDVYLRVATAGLAPSTTAYLNGVAATAVETFYQSNGTQFGLDDAEREFYFVWSGVSGSALYNFSWADPTAHISLDQLALATVAVAAVPEPSTYGMLALGLGVLAFAGRHSRKNNA
ncbi:PEP-CTERM sorting domain-containing protein [Methylobacillus caricis]|uniref:PEP-CTERM sorting domain-containing protein n=1 Tax=Methylobacillus caricis TaxID=1971611 RepID=UPI001D00136B|nr:PEP-CTERM sorting domain-containing protein [Methylobacillus caricis]MCB5187650.1 PEP-CTERM sorting domain-containing protein [Methylobacillus caricis]